MSKSEAEEYTRDSYYREQDFYHGTSKENANGIMNTGAKWSLNSENSYGDGLYMTPDNSTEIYIDRELIKRGVSPKDIILGFRSPSVRKLLAADRT